MVKPLLIPISIQLKRTKCNRPPCGTKSTPGERDPQSIFIFAPTTGATLLPCHTRLPPTFSIHQDCHCRPILSICATATPVAATVSPPGLLPPLPQPPHMGHHHSRHSLGLTMSEPRQGAGSRETLRGIIHGCLAVVLPYPTAPSGLHHALLHKGGSTLSPHLHQ